MDRKRSILWYFITYMVGFLLGLLSPSQPSNFIEGNSWSLFLAILLNNTGVGLLFLILGFTILLPFPLFFLNGYIHGQGWQARFVIIGWDALLTLSHWVPEMLGFFFLASIGTEVHGTLEERIKAIGSQSRLLLLGLAMIVLAAAIESTFMQMQ